MDKSALRNAATIIVIRDRLTNPAVLMGQRGSSAAFMPDKFVFPGGAIDPNDGLVPMAADLSEPTQSRLNEDSDLTATTIIAAAIRELWEETGQIIGTKGDWPDAPQGWRGFAAAGYLPDPSGLEFVFRAVTPEGRPRRFDARFLLVDAERLATDPDDFSGAEDELRHLQWVPLDQARSFDLPFITEVVLAEIAKNLHNSGAPDLVPFFRNDDEAHLVTRLGGKSPFDQ
ncbi:NUDIX domain-containing protein [Marivivens donghaensis]|uniref:NUDIX domain-containing protein n=1 Tax=Marivivens donghaensis TaxID=1699413 RepID=UPI00201FA3CA|nr:NUDIX hydrolase [Marivivens donghaensis]MCL7407774.1 NUDIX hydrolase [Marivivens donghaensis]MDN3704247.1 NUDIX hydrolase [Marivivens donghaensis]